MLRAGLTKPCEVGEILALHRLKSPSLDSKSEINVALFLFASRSFLANNLRFMVKIIDKAIIINGKIHNNKRKRFYSSNKEGLICWHKRITANFNKFVQMKFQVKIKSKNIQTDASCIILAVELCYIIIIWTKLE